MPPRSAAASRAADAADDSADARARHNEGHGRRLTAAFEALEAFPALAESRNRAAAPRQRGARLDRRRRRRRRVRRRARHRRAAPGQPGRGQEPRHASSPSSQAVELLSPEAVQSLATRARTFDFFERSTVWDAAPERFRLHGVATQRAADRLATEAGYEDRDRLMVTALLHDIGKLVLMHAYPGYPQPGPPAARARRRSASTASAASSASTTRWSAACSPAAGACRRRVASVIERHHADDAQRRGRLRPPRRHARPLRAGRRRLADRAAASCARTHRPRPGRAAHGHVRPAVPDAPAAPRQVDPCPLSGREVEVLKRLAEGKVYKQIAHELELSTSTVRTHLHNIYGKLGAVDRAQAVLIATERGWL